MIENVTLRMTPEQEFRTENDRRCDEMGAKELLLYAAALCSAHTALTIMRKERIAPRRFEVSYAGELSTPTLQSDSVFTSFHVLYNVACDREDDQAKVSRAIRLTHEKYCGMTQMLRRIGPVSHEIALVTADAAQV